MDLNRFEDRMNEIFDEKKSKITGDYQRDVVQEKTNILRLLVGKTSKEFATAIIAGTVLFVGGCNEKTINNTQQKVEQNKVPSNDEGKVVVVDKSSKEDKKAEDVQAKEEQDNKQATQEEAQQPQQPSTQDDTKEVKEETQTKQDVQDNNTQVVKEETNQEEIDNAKTDKKETGVDKSENLEEVQKQTTQDDTKSTVEDTKTQDTKVEDTTKVETSPTKEETKDNTEQQVEQPSQEENKDNTQTETNQTEIDKAEAKAKIKEKIAEIKKTRELTSEDMERLKSYPLHKLVDPNNDFDDMKIAYNTGTVIIDRLNSCWSPKDNQIFFTHKNLTYITLAVKYAIRGVLIEVKDGTVIEKDVEFLIRADRLNGDGEEVYVVEYIKVFDQRIIK